MGIFRTSFYLAFNTRFNIHPDHVLHIDAFYFFSDLMYVRTNNIERIRLINGYIAEYRNQLLLAEQGKNPK